MSWVSHLHRPVSGAYYQFKWKCILKNNWKVLRITQPGKIIWNIFIIFCTFNPIPLLLCRVSKCQFFVWADLSWPILWNILSTQFWNKRTKTVYLCFKEAQMHIVMKKFEWALPVMPTTFRNSAPMMENYLEHFSIGSSFFQMSFVLWKKSWKVYYVNIYNCILYTGEGS